MSLRVSAEDELEQRALDAPADAIVDAGFDRFIEGNWEALLRGESFVRPFLVPSRLEFVRFALRRVDHGMQTERAVLQMAVDFALTRLFAPAMRVAYDTRDRSLGDYPCVSNLRDARGRNLNVAIHFGEGRERLRARRHHRQTPP